MPEEDKKDEKIITEEQFRRDTDGRPREVKELSLKVPPGATEEEIHKLLLEKFQKIYPDKPLKIGKVPTEKVRFYLKEIHMLMDCFGMEVHILTDWSRLGDFPFSDQEIEEVSDALGVPLSKEDHLWEIGSRLAIKQ